MTHRPIGRYFIEDPKSYYASYHARQPAYEYAYAGVNRIMSCHNNSNCCCYRAHNYKTYCINIRVFEAHNCHPYFTSKGCYIYYSTFVKKYGLGEKVRGDNLTKPI